MALLALLGASPAVLPPARAFAAPRLADRSCCAVMSDGEKPPAVVDPDVTADNPKGLTGPLITYSGISPEMRNLVDEAFQRRNRERLLTDKPPYASVEAMVDAYVELGSAQGWTREDAESEVVRFLQRRALAEEGGFSGEPQDYAAQVLLALLVGSIGYSTATGGGISTWENPFF
mmetsp:Transcript_3715/g.12481  ORF Transcript_3715/g.12481 Transcript_3715/m.12481 type:complete len:175 (-) Transcript_3715:229-753(-)